MNESTGLTTSAEQKIQSELLFGTRIMAFLVIYIILLLLSAIIVSFFVFLADNPLFHLGILVLAGYLTYVRAYDKVPSAIVSRFHHIGPSLVILILFIISGYVIFNTFSLFNLYFSDMGIDYSEGLVFSLALAELSALILLLRSMYTRKDRQKSHRSLDSDMQSVVTMILGIESDDLFSKKNGVSMILLSSHCIIVDTQHIT